MISGNNMLSRNTQVSRFGLLAVILACAMATGCGRDEAPVEEVADRSQTVSQPNILLMVVEDLSPRIGAFGDPVARTPNLDRLAAEGVRYTNVFATAGVCAPSRAALMTGMYQQSIGAQHMRTSSFGRSGSGELGTFRTPGPPYQTVPPPEVKAFPELLRAAGYFTINNVKTDYQFGEPFTIWDVHDDGATLRDRAADQPFLIMHSNSLTHESSLFRREWVSTPERAVRAAERNAVRRAELDVRTDPAEVEVPRFLPDTTAVREELAILYDNVGQMDAWVGERLAELEAEGLADDTIVIWTTDHGDGLPRAKRSIYDSGIRVPMIIRFPDGRDAGAVVDDLISFVDLAPTLLELARAPVPGHMHGRNFLSDSVAKREYVYAARDRLDELPDKSRAVRDRQYKYIRNYVSRRPFFAPLYFRENLSSMAEMRRLLDTGGLPEHIAGYFTTPRPAEELYDVLADPDEVHNLAADPGHRDALLRLGAELDRWLETVGDMSDRPESQMVDEMWHGGRQPTTAAPLVNVDCSGADAVVGLSSPTPGASIGFRIAGHDDTRWRLAGAGLRIAKGQTIEAKAVRYGYRESRVLRQELCPDS